MTKSRNINTKRYKWTELQNAIMRATYACTANSALIKIFGCTRTQVYSQAAKLGLKKSAWFFKYNPTSESLVFTGNRGADTRFKPGNTPHNKGKKGWCMAGAEKGWFKKGSKPKNLLPIGTIRKMDREGYYEVKIAETGKKATDWVPVHRLIWQRLTGKPIPRDHLVIYQDGNYENQEIGNLACISKKEHCLRNSVHAYGPEIYKITQLRAQITRQINKRNKLNEQRTNPL